MLAKDTRGKNVEGFATVSFGSTEKDRALFYLARRLKALAEVVVKHEGMAEMGLSYESRIIHQRAIDKQNEDNQHEREALQWLLDQVMEKL